MSKRNTKTIRVSDPGLKRGQPHHNVDQAASIVAQNTLCAAAKVLGVQSPSLGKYSTDIDSIHVELRYEKHGEYALYIRDVLIKTYANFELAIDEFEKIKGENLPTF